MKPPADYSSEELNNLIFNYRRLKKTDDPYYAELLDESGRRTGKGLDFDTTMRAVLKAARDGRFISYGELSEASGVDWSTVRYAMNRHLQELIEYCHHQDWPLISSIVVTKDNLQTGAMDEGTLNGFVAGCKTVGYVIADPEAFLREQQNKVFKWAAEFEQFEELTEEPQQEKKMHSKADVSEEADSSVAVEKGAEVPKKAKISNPIEEGNRDQKENFGKVFFTYVWGAPGNPAWPLTFATKAARSHARAVLQEGDIVFTVGTRTDPTAPEHKGRVVGAYRVSDMEVNTRDYVDLLDEERRSEDAIDRFPYALHPLEVWEIAGQENMFSELVGPLTGRHHLQARDKVIELDALTAEPLLALERTPVMVVEPKTILGRGRVALKNSKLAPKHEGDFQGSFGHHEIWYVYVLALRDQRGKDLAFKIGYAHDPKKRRDEHNRPLATEVTGLEWHVALKQETSSEDDARTVEQALLNKYRERCLRSNGEIVSGVTVTDISLSLASVLRET
ncbi:GIY-YIG nuclease family protein [Labrenzia sp. 5N]|uniref:GIY-YIG nuclease family protein n=1 Tax=Labrenzia sp. 5N TaxID=2723402 RepID=UPI0014489310|nr:GIY-YIG nuclease family protein [Labrenzia sp. 5N]NKX63733.1 GIY-YIG nuclease family protein [Labrenzia sp. 5N]